MALFLKDIDVYILCGGLGKRLKKITREIPKPMAEICGRPFLDILLGELTRIGFRRFILGVGYNAEFIMDYYRKNKPSGSKIVFSREKTPLGTGGAVKEAKRLIKGSVFFVLNGDSFSKFNAKDLLAFHKDKKALVSILLRRAESGHDYGRIRLAKDLRITGFDEKTVRPGRCLINAGVYIFDRKIFDLMPGKRKFSLERELFPSLAGKGIYGYKGSGLFIDIGTPERYILAPGVLKKVKER